MIARGPETGAGLGRPWSSRPPALPGAMSVGLSTCASSADRMPLRSAILPGPSRGGAARTARECRSAVPSCSGLRAAARRVPPGYAAPLLHPARTFARRRGAYRPGMPLRCSILPGPSHPLAAAYRPGMPLRCTILPGPSRGGAGGVQPGNAAPQRHPARTFPRRRTVRPGWLPILRHARVESQRAGSGPSDCVNPRFKESLAPRPRRVVVGRL